MSPGHNAPTGKSLLLILQPDYNTIPRTSEQPLRLSVFIYLFIYYEIRTQGTI